MPLCFRIISENRKLLGDEWTREFVACGGTIGRSLDNDWVLPDKNLYVSGRHALIDFQAGAYYLVDTSRNGVYINGADTPVGRGHPQRLFDGDQLNIGEFEILIEITEDDEDIADDGMRDSVVRAQLVDIDESVEMALMDDAKLVDSGSISEHLVDEESARVTGLSALIPGGPGDTQSQEDTSTKGQAKALALFLEAAGLTPGDVAGAPTSEVLQGAGKLMRMMVAGLMDLLHDRSQVKETFRLSQTIIRSKSNNPLKFSPNVADALRYLLGDRSDSYLSAEEAVTSVLKDIKTHEKATVNAMLQALVDYTERFDPDELRNQYDRGLKRGSLLAGANKFKYWQLYEESYQILTGSQDGRMPEAFSKEFIRAYEEEVAQAKVERQKSPQ
jgi:predicted component of type VI protein secretion system